MKMNMSRGLSEWLLACSLAAVLFFAGCGPPKPEGRLIGRWRLDGERTLSEARRHFDEQKEDIKGTAEEQAINLGLGLVETMVKMQDREMTFKADGTVRAVIRSAAGQILGMGGGIVMREEEAFWEVLGYDGDAVTVLIKGGEAEFAEWERVLHFEDGNRFYFYTAGAGVREYWVRD